MPSAQTVDDLGTTTDSATRTACETPEDLSLPVTIPQLDGGAIATPGCAAGFAGCSCSSTTSAASSCYVYTPETPPSFWRRAHQSHLEALPERVGRRYSTSGDFVTDFGTTEWVGLHVPSATATGSSRPLFDGREVETWAAR